MKLTLNHSLHKYLNRDLISRVSFEDQKMEMVFFFCKVKGKATPVLFEV